MARRSYKNLDFNKIKAKIVDFRANVAGIIYNGLVHEVPRSKIIQNLKNQARYTAEKCGFTPSELEQLYQSGYRTYTKCLKNSSVGLYKARKERKGISYRKYLKSRSDVVYKQMDTILFSDEELNKATNAIVAEKEKDFRLKQFRNLFDQPDPARYTPFMLCSAHVNPAKDHAEWQGRIYFDADFASKVENQIVLSKVSAYIRNHKLISVQEIMGPPVYMCTRRNCKHYFVPIPIERVLTSSVGSILKSYHMVRQEEESISPERRAKNIYRARYAMRKEMWKVMPNDELAKDMSKDKKLIKKWTTLDRAKTNS